ncbi:MAG: sensor histidine kinase N-terminal domain-containing protein [Candidatus Thiodiazotropha sp. (ex Semelilucina semeliformis)]|nr:sensor histidine kinase N-terminal domain-containing protein [Candidatus Thiodiazotropha sp. (ex Semelilucina semeliformis)]
MTYSRSIRFRLLVMILLSVLLLWSAVLGFTWRQTSRDINQVYDAELAQVAKLLAVTTAHEAEEHDLDDYEADLSEAGYDFPLVFQIWSQHNNHLSIKGPEAPDQPLSPSIEDGYSDNHFNGADWRIYTLNLENHGFRVQVARARAAMDQMVSDFVIDVLKPLLLALPLFGMLWYIVHRGLAPLRHVSRLIAERDYSHLNPVTVAHIPEESSRLVEEINALLGRLKNSIERNSRFTADVAHELRTPIAGMLVQLQSSDSSLTEDERQQIIDKVTAGLKRLSHVVNQLLTLASIEPEKLRQSFEPIELRALATEVISEHSPVAIDKHIELELDAIEPVELYGNKQLIGILIGNLLQNAIKFTPEKGSIKIHLAKVTNGVMLSVEDTGPGIPDDKKSWVFERLNRVPSGGGSGLGLSIVKEICKLHRASITLSDRVDASGLIVNLFLPS